MQKICCKTAIERLAQIGSKSVSTMSLGGSLVSLRMLRNKSVKLLTICSHHIFDIGYILQPAFYLERSGTCENELIKMVQLVQILQ